MRSPLAARRDSRANPPAAIRSPRNSSPAAQQGKDEAAKGDNPLNSEKQRPGGQGPGGDQQQLAQGGPKPDGKKPTGSGGSNSLSPPGGQKLGDKPKEENGKSQGEGAGSKSKSEEKKDGGGQSGGGDKPKPGQGDQEGDSGNKKPGGKKPDGNKGGTADGDHEGQKNPGTSGDPTRQDSSGAPDSQVDPEHGGHKEGDARNGLNPKSDNPQSPGNSPHDSSSASETPGDRKGGGGAGGGQPDKKTGKGAAGSHSPAANGGAVSDERGDDATGKKAGEQVRSPDRTGSQRKESGKGDGEKHEPADDHSAQDDAQKPRGNSAQNSTQSEDKSSGGQAGAQSSQQAGRQGSGPPAGGSPANGSDTPASPPHEPAGEPDAANLAFTKQQVDLALEHLKDEKGKRRSDLLDHLGWTKEEAQKFVENISKLKDSAEQRGSEGEAAKKAYNEFLKNLDLHPHGTKISGGSTQTDDMRNVRDSGRMEAPSDWAELYHAYSHATAGGK